METTTNKDVNVLLNSESGTVCLTNLLPDTMVYLYNSQGGLQVKQRFALPSLNLMLSERGMYVLVVSHPSCKVEVRRFVY